MPPSVHAYLGVDIGKTAHYAVAVEAQTGQSIHRTAVANEEPALRALVDWAQAHQAALVVDQSSGAAALLLQLCWDQQVPVGYLHGLAMARARDFYAGEGKTDPKDAFVLADVARAHPTRVVWLTPTAEARAQLALLCGYDADLRADANRLTNRLRAVLSTYWPALEQALGDRLDTPAVLALLGKYPSGPALKGAGRTRLLKRLRTAHARQPEALVDRLLAAVRDQPTAIVGATTAAQVVGELAAQLARVLERRRTLGVEIAQAFFALPEAPLLQSLPGIGPRLGAQIAVEIGDIKRFPNAAQLAAYAGLGPTPRQSGTSLRGNRASHHGNHRLKHAFFQAAFASLRHAPSRTYYDRKRTEGKRHHQAVLCRARRRVDVLHAMLTHRTPYQERSTSPPLAASA
jgi:Transposase/Transposase IS116/IS110/IS902 family